MHHAYNHENDSRWFAFKKIVTSRSLSFSILWFTHQAPNFYTELDAKDLLLALIEYLFKLQIAGNCNNMMWHFMELVLQKELMEYFGKPKIHTSGVVDGDGFPPLPWKLLATSLFSCWTHNSHILLSSHQMCSPKIIWDGIYRSMNTFKAWQQPREKCTANLQCLLDI